MDVERVDKEDPFSVPVAGHGVLDVMDKVHFRSCRAQRGGDHLAGHHIQIADERGRPMPLVFELLAGDLVGLHVFIGSNPFQGLDTGHLVGRDGLNEEIAREVGLERKQVGLWRRRWQAAWETLTLLEYTESRKLREAVRETLRDAPRSGSPGTFTAEQITQILAVACEDPALSDRPITHWTHRELRDEVIGRGIVQSISESRIGHFLREAALQPHRRKMWLNTKEKDPRGIPGGRGSDL